MKILLLRIIGFVAIWMLAPLPMAIAQHHHHDHHQQHYDANLARVQHRLADLNFYHGAVDGIWGQESRAAIVAYQHRHNLQETGTITDQLLHHLGLH